MNNYTGSCCCSKVKFICYGEPLFTQYCHCNKCREVAGLSSCENDKRGYAFTAAYLTKDFEVTTDADLQVITRNNAKLLLCPSCKSLIYGMSLDPALQEGIGVNAYNFDITPLPKAFNAVRHIWYQNKTAAVNDKLPKFKDAPKDQGGTGELC